MKAIIASVSLNPKPHTNSFGKQVYYINGSIDDKTVFALTAQSEEKAKEIEAKLKELIGKEAEYELEDNGKTDRDGRKQLYMKSYPGKPQGFGGRGGKEFIPRYRDTEQGTKEERLSIARSVALQQAVAWAPRWGQVDPGHQTPVVSDILNIATEFYAWLIKEQPPIQASQGAGMQVGSSAPAALPQSQSGDTPPPARTYNKPPCPQCDKGSEFVFQAKDRATGQYIPGSYYCWKTKGGCGHQWKEASELAEAFSMQTADQIKTAFQKYQDEIRKAIDAKDSGKLERMLKLIGQSMDSGTVSVDEAERLDKEISEARKIVASGLTHAQWHDQKVKEAQQKLQFEQGQESAFPLDQESIPF